MKVGYVRVSTKEQNTARQEILMEQLGVDKVYIEKVSGKNTNRPQLKAMLEFVRKGDTVVVESISRFARNTKDLLELIELLQEKKVEFISQKEAIDTTTPTGKFMLTIFGAVSELERSYILQRQREGIDAMPIDKKTGKKKSSKTGRVTGRPSMKYPKEWTKIYKQYTEKELNVKQICKLYDIPRSSFYVLVDRYKQENNLN